MTWPKVISKLEAWASDPSAQAHPIAIKLAVENASRMRSRGFSPPTYVELTPDGGVVKFKWQGNDVLFETHQYPVDIVPEMEATP